MQEINETLFLLINAPATPNAIILAVAKVFADQAIWLAPMALIIGWFRGSERTRAGQYLRSNTRPDWQCRGRGARFAAGQVQGAGEDVLRRTAELRPTK